MKPGREQITGNSSPLPFTFAHQDFPVKEDTKVMWNQVLPVPVCGTVSKEDGRRKGSGGGRVIAHLHEI